MSLKDMPMATIEQQAEFRRAALEREKELITKVSRLHNTCCLVKTVFDRNLGSNGYVPTFGKLATDDCIFHLENAIKETHK